MDSITRALLNEFVQRAALDDISEDKQFEHFAAFSVISSRYPDDFDTDDVVTGGGADLGIDAFAVVVNGRLVEDAQAVTDLLDLNGYLDVEFILVQAKRSGSFDGASIMAMADNVKSEIFSGSTIAPVNDDVRRLIQIQERIYQNAAKLKGNPELRIAYVTTGTWNNDPYLTAIVDRKRSELAETNLFKEVRIEPVGASQLQKLYRETKSSISREITFSKFVVLPEIKNVKASYLGALPATEFIKIISDDDGNILKSIFVDNVRDFQGENPVNKDISLTISGGHLDQFALRNNGVTIVSREISTTGDKFSLKDYQIVNGCQTSHVIFANRDALTTDLLIPLKLIHTEDEEITQQVIKSTNRQTPVDEDDLLALTLFQRNLEDYYSGFADDKKLFYERRSKQFGNRPEVEKNRIVPIGMQLKFFSSMFLDVPHQAGRYQGTLLKAVNERVFKADHRPEPYYTSALCYYRFDGYLKKLSGEDSKLKSFKFHMLAAFRHRFEAEEASDFSHPRKVAAYCEPLNRILWDADDTKAAFDDCLDIVKLALTSRGLSWERDSAKSRDLSDEIRSIARARNDNKAR